LYRFETILFKRAIFVDGCPETDLLSLLTANKNLGLFSHSRVFGAEANSTLELQIADRKAEKPQTGGWRRFNGSSW